MRVLQPDGPHRAKAEGVVAAPGDDFYRQAALKELRAGLLEVAQLDLLGLAEGADEARVLLAGQRAVDVVALIFLPPVVAAGAKRLAHVDRLGLDDGAERVEEVEILLPAQPGDIRRQGVAGQRAAGNNGRPVGDGGNLLADQLDAWVSDDPLLDAGGEELAIDGEAAAGGHGSPRGAVENERAETAQLRLEQPRRLGGNDRAEAVAADHSARRPVTCAGVCRRGRIS